MTIAAWSSHVAERFIATHEIKDESGAEAAANVAE